MSAKRRAVAPLLTLQALVFVVITIAVGAVYAVERATVGAEVENPAKQLRQVRGDAMRALALPYAVAATRDEGIAQEAKSARMRAEHGLDQLEASIGSIKGAKPAIADARRALGEARHLLASIEAASPDTRLTNAFSELSAEQEKLEEALDRIDVRSDSMLSFHYEKSLQLLMGLWGAALVTALVTGLGARRRSQANELEAEERTNRALDGLTRVVRQALDEEEVQLGLLPSREPYSVVGEATGRLVSKVEGLLKANREMARSNNFLQELQEALSLAETEQAVHQTAIRAAASAYHDLGFQLITIDDDTRDVRLANPDEEPLCAFSSPEDCPAMSHGRTWHHRVDDALARCPRLTDADTCVTCAPIQVDGKPTAVAQLSRYQPSTVRFEELEALALATTVRLSVTRSIAARTAESETDPLTELANRRLYERRVEELDAAGTSYALVMADLDHFKQLNDRYGHDVGDRCLEIFAQVLRDACRGSDLACRLGGEEFVLVLPGVGVKAGLAVALRIRAYLADAASRGPAPFTVSLGVAARPEHGASAEAVLRAADAALYDAKEAGRDQVVPARMQTNLEAAR